MKFKMPDTLDGASIEELTKLSEQALEESRELAKISDEEITDEQISDLENLGAHLSAIKGAQGELEAAAVARAERITSAKSAVSTLADESEDGEEPVDGEDPVGGEEPAEEPEAPEDTETPDLPEEAPVAEGDEEDEDEKKPFLSVETTDAIAEPIENEKEPDVATKTVGKAAEKSAPIESLAPEAPAPQVTIVAAAGIPGIEPNRVLNDMTDVATAFLASTRGAQTPSNSFGKSNISLGGISLSDSARVFGVAQIQKPDAEFSTGMDETAEMQFSTLMAAASEHRLPGGSLVAAGGWCAPSETLYDSFAALEDGNAALYSLPEVNARRGGIRFTRGPQLGDVMNADGSFGFRQTEAQAIAGQLKTLISLECPDFEDVRMDALGYGVTVPILTNKAFPELVKRYIALAAVAHRLRMNSARISAVSTKAGTAINYVELGAAASDILDAITIQAIGVRYSHSMNPAATIEVVMETWVRDFLRADLSRRNGVDLLAVSDAQIDAYFRARGLAPQFVRGLQPWTSTLSGSGTKFPGKIQAILYPAGTFVALTEGVIDVNGVYDTDGLTKNTFTGVFFEEGFNVAQMSGSAVKVEIDVTPHGLSGAASVGPVAP